jgi:hypothetical protein
MDPSNRRISLIVQWVELPVAPKPSEAKSGEMTKERPIAPFDNPAKK